MDEKKVCKDCQSKINIKSKKCIECGSLLDWRRHSSEISAFLALFLAAIATFAWAEPIIRKYVIGFKDELTIISANAYFNVIKHEDSGHSLKGIQVAISNTGDHPAFVQDIGIVFKFSGEDESKDKNNDPPKLSGVIYYNELPDIYKNPGIIKEKNSELYRLFLTNSIALPQTIKSLKYYGEKNNYSPACKISIDWITSKGETKKLLKDLNEKNCKWSIRLAVMRLGEENGK
ncbi:hypothetical protein PS862_04126 [Pseudomonas fluorescens]|uniref:Uncharacterized protein n=1 Tax=Pseudomonas fluorescens TaxID=294 RepID=A0A5E7MNV0_PSEFL|nr:hypothetical protein [Pseudomonas fluorescens]VVP26352.1 hypothetical protein PS862_04126 [Pseudomonas fluorescens]